MRSRLLNHWLTPRSRWIALAGVMVLVGSAINSGGAPLDRAKPEDKKALELADHMGEMSRALRRLKRQVAEPRKNDSSLALVVTIQQHALAAKGMAPSMVADIPYPQQKKFVLEYRKQIIRLMTALLELEDQLLDEQNTGAAKSLQRILQVQKVGHRQFRKEEK